MCRKLTTLNVENWLQVLR
ncbi:MAG: hypothetical protein JXJ17_02280 [Anaerolineae bacterium]|nr:hypothetical protein [Anaerolineae bacterium]